MKRSCARVCDDDVCGDASSRNHMHTNTSIFFYFGNHSYFFYRHLGNSRLYAADSSYLFFCDVMNFQRFCPFSDISMSEVLFFGLHVHVQLSSWLPCLNQCGNVRAHLIVVYFAAHSNVIHLWMDSIMHFNPHFDDNVYRLRSNL